MVVLNIFHVLIAISMIALVLVQRGAGATAGAAFGSGASGTVFGARGAGTFLTKSTWVLGALFCAISLTMAVMISRLDISPESDLGVVSSAPAAVQETATLPGTEGTETAKPAEQVDVPTFELNENAAGDEKIILEPAAEDLPALDSEAVESTDNNPGETATGAGSDDS